MVIQSYTYTLTDTYTYILFNKLAALGMSDKALSWFQSYISNRRQCVKYNGILSDYEQIAFGVPEGSVLGPTVFIVYINDLLLSLPDSSATAYADDITVIASGIIIDRATSHLQDLLNTICTWSARNALHLNIAKCFVMHVMPSLRQHRSADVRVYLGSCRLAQMHQLSLLGVLLSNGLSWTSQARKVKSKIASRIAAIQRFDRCLNSKTHLLAYNAFVLSHLTYCLPVWGNTNASVARDFDKVLTCCLQSISGSDKSTLSCDSFTDYKISDFTNQVFMCNILTVFTQLHLPVERRVFNPCFLSSSYPTRTSSCNKLSIDIIKRTADRYCFNATAPSN